jgi:hypothetical protein
MKTKKLLATVALLSVALWTGCATGGGGHTGAQIQVTVNTNPANQPNVGVTLKVQFVATVTGTDNTAVTWSLSQPGGGTCTGTPNPCGSIDANGLYTAPTVAPSPSTVNVTATSVANTTKSDTYNLLVLPITVIVTPTLKNPLPIVQGVSQVFTAIATPDNAPQTFDWSIVCDAGPNLCGTLTFDPNASTTATFTAIQNPTPPGVAHITATSKVVSSGTDTVDVQIVKSRLSPLTTYAFHFSGFDSNGPIAVAGNFLTDTNGAIVGGTEDELTTTTQVTRTIDNASAFAPDTQNPTNVHGTLTLHTSAGARSYKVVFNTEGNGRMIEFDNTGRHGSGEIVQATPSKFNNNAFIGCTDANSNSVGCSFVFGLAGIDPVLKRTGLAGVFQADPTIVTKIDSGLLDVNDFGTANPNSSGDAITAGNYNIGSDGRGTLSLADNDSGKTYNYAVYVVGGQAGKANNPLTLFAISTDDPQTNPAVIGTIVAQDPTQVYDNAALNDFTVSNLTGLDSSGTKTLVSLTNGDGDGNGKFTASYDANNAGQIVKADSQHPFTYNYAFTSGAKGRYTVDLLGNPNANPVVPSVHFVLYLSAANRGFLLDQSSQAVLTGTMDPQTGGNFAGSELAGSLEAATGSSATSGVNPMAVNFLFTSIVPNFTVAGVRDLTGDPQPETLAGTYSVDVTGTGTIKLTQPGAENYVIYFLDNPSKSGDMIQHFVMINVDSTNTNPAVIFGER